MEKQWTDLTPAEKREERFKRWLSPTDVKFTSREAENKYKEKVTRFIKAIKMEKPDRVPVKLPVEYFPAYYGGVNLKTVMYDSNELKRAWLKFLRDFDTDTFVGPGLVTPGKVLDMLDFKIQKWPGHGLPDDADANQFVEGDYMKPEDYDAFINDPTDYLLRNFLPTSVGAFKAFRKLKRLMPSMGIGYVTQFGEPDIQEALQALMNAGREATKWVTDIKEVRETALAAGFPDEVGGFCQVPYDLIGDNLRGTPGIMMDMYRCPDKLHEAMERLVPISITECVLAANTSGCPIIVFGLHKGSAGYMSPKQFETFYWPTLKKVITGLVNEGLVPELFAEGNYEPRLEIITDLPKASVVWGFEQMDMAKAKKIVGRNSCISGNISASVLCKGTPQEVKDSCRQLIETCAPGGGYILAGAMRMESGNPENLHAIMAAAKEYGVYK